MGKENLHLIYSMRPEDIQAKIEEYLPIREEKKKQKWRGIYAYQFD